MDIILELKQTFIESFKTLGVSLVENDIVIEKSKDPSHGDYCCNAALKYSRLLGKNPQEAAKLIVASLSMDKIERYEIAGPGFINLFIKNDSLQSIIKKVISDGDNYGKANRLGKKINIEFVSANPTGDLHVGTARGAAIGDSLARILDASGFDVTREYYINDAGNQIYNLALSIQARYFEILGKDFELPEDGYHGEDVRRIARQIYDEIGDSALFMDDPISYFKERGIELEMKKINRDLQAFDLNFDIFSSEKKIRSNNAVEKELEYLDKYCSHEDGATILRTTEFLDDKDRVIVKSNGDYTYFLPDIVYHLNKLSRGYDKLIDVLGADHHGYINRMKSALMMHGYSQDILDVELIQMVRFIQDGVEKKASKRAGDAFTLNELIEDVGKDAGRYFFAMRAPSSHLDFDITLAVEQSSNNPVFYCQYAHARMCSVLETGKDIPIDENASMLTTEKEKALLRHIESYPKLVVEAANELAPHRVTNYVHELAELVHAWYNDCKIVDKDNISLSSSRLALCKAIKQVIKNSLYLVGVDAPERM